MNILKLKFECISILTEIFMYTFPEICINIYFNWNLHEYTLQLEFPWIYTLLKFACICTLPEICMNIQFIWNFHDYTFYLKFPWINTLTEIYMYINIKTKFASKHSLSKIFTNINFKRNWHEYINLNFNAYLFYVIFSCIYTLTEMSQLWHAAVKMTSLKTLQ